LEYQAKNHFCKKYREEFETEEARDIRKKLIAQGWKSQIKK
tara:strand:+ start:183 stop:305 length:123 start_codon:yes stop_codon:yes gene_type:complete